jgi:hypothetical protein
MHASRVVIPKMLSVGVGNWIRRLFSSNEADDEATQREEDRLPDRGESELERDLGSFAESEGAEAAKARLDEFKAPRDPAP